MEQFEAYYQEKLLPALTELENERKVILRKLNKLKGYLLILVLAGVALVYFLEHPGWLIGAGVLALIIYFVMRGIYSKDYHHGFKTRVINAIVKFIDDNLEFDHNGKIAESEFASTKIFQRSRDRYSGEDLVYGKLDKTEIRFSEVHAEYKTESRDSDGNTRTSWHTIFKGILFVADFNKHFNSEVFVMPDTLEKMFGKWGQKFQSSSKHGKLVKLEDPEFEKEFAVYSNDQVDARYILSTSLMQRIVEFKKKTKNKVYLSFVDSKLNVAITLSKDLFEARLNQTLLDYTYIKSNLDYFLLFTGIVEDLNLNTRIWTKS